MSSTTFNQSNLLLCKLLKHDNVTPLVFQQQDTHEFLHYIPNLAIVSDGGCPGNIISMTSLSDENDLRILGMSGRCEGGS